jgi:hypothetical protein
MAARASCATTEQKDLTTLFSQQLVQVVAQDADLIERLQTPQDSLFGTLCSLHVPDANKQFANDSGWLPVGSILRSPPTTRRFEK